MKKILKNELKNGNFDNVSENRSKIMSAVKAKNNRSTERRLRFSMVKNEIRGWIINTEKIFGKPDFYFPKEKVAVFVDGCFWHGCSLCGHIPKTNSSFWKKKIEDNKQRDLNVNKFLEKKGVKVLRFWEHNLSNNLNNCIEIIKREIRD